MENNACTSSKHGSPGGHSWHGRLQTRVFEYVNSLCNKEGCLVMFENVDESVFHTVPMGSGKRDSR